MRKITVCKAFLMAALLLAMAWSEGKGQLLIENFDYPAGPGDSLVMHGWTPHSARNFVPLMVTTPGLTYTNYAGSNIGNATTAIGGSGSREDAHRTFSPQTSTVYAAFLVNVQSCGNDSDYFFHLGPDVIGTTFRGRVFVDGNGSGNFAFGITFKGNTPVTTSYTYSFGTTYLLVVKAEWGGNTKLFINPVIGEPEPSATITSTDFDVNPVNYGAVAIRQGSRSYNVIIDGIRIANSWSEAVAAPNDPPTTFNLLEPADGFRWVVSSTSNDSIYYRWTQSFDPEDSIITYSFEYDTAATMDSPLHNFYPIGTDTFFVDHANWEAEWLQGLGLDSMTLYWRINASDGVLGRVSEDLFSIKYVLAPNEPPSAFDLIEPADGFRWEVSISSTDSLYWRWNRSIDPENDPVYYSIEYDTSAAMNSPLHDYFFIGTDTIYVDHANMEAEFLHSLGVDSLTVYWRIVATDSLNDYVTSNQTWSIKYVLIPESVIPFRAQLAGYQVVPPTNSQFTGWGYFEMSSDSSNLFYRIYIPDGVSPVTIRNNWAGSGSDDPVLYEYPLVGDSAVGNQAIPIEIARELCAGRLYVLHPGVGIRGQIYHGTAPVTLNPARALNAIEFEGSIELDWTEPLFYESAKHYRFSDKQFSRRKHDTPSRAAASSGAPLLTGYNIYRSTDGLGFIKIHQTDLLYFIDSNVTTGNNYWYFVSAVYLEGQAPWTDTIVATPAIPYSFVEGFNDTTMTVPGTLPEGWSKVDADGGDEDPFTGEWRVVPELDSYFTTYEGEGMMSINFEAANPNGLIDEWLISPYLMAGTTAPRLSFFVHASADLWPDSLQVLISTTDKNLTSFTPIDYFEGQGVWTEYNYDLSAYGITAGDSFYVAFRYLIYDGGSYGNSSDLINLDYVRIDGNPIVISVNDPVAGAPKQFALHQNYPNPFNPSTAITYDIKDPGKVSIKIYNTLGQEVRTLVNAKQNAGTYSIMWDGRNNAGQAVSSGIYIYRMQTGNFIQSRKMMFLK